MSVTFSMVLSDKLNDDLRKVIKRGEEPNMSEIVRKALGLYLVGKQGKTNDLELGLFDKDGVLHKKIVGL